MNSSPEEMQKRTVAVVGLGYVGCVTASCLSSIGHTVIGVDRDLHKVHSIEQGLPPFHEPGLGALVEQGRREKRLSATDSMEAAIRDADVALLCVGTPSGANGDISLEQLRRVCMEIAPLLEGRSKPLVVAVRSTVFPGSTEQLLGPALGNHPNAPVVCNPEFLREGCAVKDFMEPSLLVVGSNDASAARTVAGLYAALPVAASITSLRTAEMIKYACNAFHAVKISFANEIGSLAARLGVDGEEVMSTLALDRKLNVSAAYLRPGFAFGGSCLPKDLRALTYRSLRLDLKLPMLESILGSNREHLLRSIEASLSFGEDCIGIYGLTFKEDTDDLRESPVITLIEQMLAKGRDVRIFDPNIDLGAIYGSNRQFLFSVLPHIGRLMSPGLEKFLAESKRIILTQNLSAAHLDAIRASGLPVLDLRKVPAPKGAD